MVVALRDERRCLPAARDDVVLGGIGPARAEAAAESLVATGVEALLSFGVAGGLDPTLRPGRVVVPARVCSATDDFETAPPLHAHLHRLLADAVDGTHVATDTPVLTPLAKQALHARHGALTVDMESGAVARVAARHGLPFAVLRAVADDAATVVPEAALRLVDAFGRPRPARIVAELVRRPLLITELVALGRRHAAALAALRKAAPELQRLSGAGQGA